MRENASSPVISDRPVTSVNKESNGVEGGEMLDGRTSVTATTAEEFSQMPTLGEV